MIKSLKAKEILNSRIEPTVKVELETEKGVFEASAPSGSSTGKYETKEVSFLKAIYNVNKVIAPKIIGRDETKQEEIDKMLSKKLGVNAILPVSIAVCRAGAAANGLPLWKYISQIIRVKPGLPLLCVLVVEGGLHAENSLDIQEFLLVGEFEKIKKVYNKIGRILGINKIGQEGGFAPDISDPEEVLDSIIWASKGEKIKIGLDCAATHLKKDKYNLLFYQELVKKYPIILLEDPFSEDDWKNWQEITKKLGRKIIIIGDDLLTTNVKRIKMAKKKKACNGIIIKPNQIGTVTETLQAAKLAKSYDWKTIVSHRSGETMDDFIADLAVGIGADFIKSGGPAKPERLAKYNRLSEIENEL